MNEEKNVYELMNEAYKQVYNGLKRVDLESDDLAVKAYQAGDIIRIDIKHK